MSFLPLIWENVSISVLFRLKNVVNVDILFTGKCKTKLSMCYSLQTSADGRRTRPAGRQRVYYIMGVIKWLTVVLLDRNCKYTAGSVVRRRTVTWRPGPSIRNQRSTVSKVVFLTNRSLFFLDNHGRTGLPSLVCHIKQIKQPIRYDAPIIPPPHRKYPIST